MTQLNKRTNVSHQPASVGTESVQTTLVAWERITSVVMQQLLHFLQLASYY